jgi:hypothetical protein
VLDRPAAHVLDDLRHEFFGFAQHEMADIRKGGMSGREERSPGNDGLPQARQRFTISSTESLWTIMALSST